MIRTNTVLFDEGSDFNAVKESQCGNKTNAVRFDEGPDFNAAKEPQCEAVFTDPTVGRDLTME
jgi:hypothetical protein